MLVDMGVIVGKVLMGIVGGGFVLFFLKVFSFFLIVFGIVFSVSIVVFLLFGVIGLGS